MNYLVKFNEQLDFFCNFLSNIFQNEPDVMANISILKLFQKTNTRKVAEFFYSELIIYEKEICDMNEQFFVDLSIKNRAQFSESKYGTEICQVIELIHSHLNDPIMKEPCSENVNETNKTRIWKYLKVLIFLSKKIN
jgi:hypothetical protein